MSFPETCCCAVVLVTLQPGFDLRLGLSLEAGGVICITQVA